MEYLGRYSNTKSGRKIQVIALFGNGLIVKFEDCIEKFCSVGAFDMGMVAHPLYDFRDSDKRKYIGVSGIIDGKRYRILEYSTRSNVTIMLENGTVLKHIKLGRSSFIKTANYIESRSSVCIRDAKPSIDANSEEINKNKSVVNKTTKCMVISNTAKEAGKADIKNTDISSRLKVSSDSKPKKKSKQRCKDANIFSHLYETCMMDCGLICELITYYDNNKIDVEFENGVIVEDVPFSDYMARKLYPIGYIKRGMRFHTDFDEMCTVIYSTKKYSAVRFALGDVAPKVLNAKIISGDIKPLLDRDKLTKAYKVGNIWRYVYEVRGSQYLGTIDEIIMQMKYGKVERFYVCAAFNGEVCVKDIKDGSYEWHNQYVLKCRKGDIRILGL